MNGHLKTRFVFVNWATIGLICLLAHLSAMFPGCRRPENAPVANQPPAAQPASAAQVPMRLDFETPIEDPGRWLFVQKVADKAEGGWAGGSFDPQRNKLVIETRDIEGFAVDMSKVGIDWNKLVILSIDGKNSELRKRDYDLVHFVRTPHGEWIVKEP